jgi:hypothetical protein
LTSQTKATYGIPSSRRISTSTTQQRISLPQQSRAPIRPTGFISTEPGVTKSTPTKTLDKRPCRTLG